MFSKMCSAHCAPLSNKRCNWIRLRIFSPKSIFSSMYSRECTLCW